MFFEKSKLHIEKKIFFRLTKKSKIKKKYILKKFKSLSLFMPNFKKIE